MTAKTRAQALIAEARKAGRSALDEAGGKALLSTYGLSVPRSVLAEARRSPEAVQLRKDSVAKLRRLCRELGLVNPLSRWVWKRCGLWDDDVDDAPVAAAG